MMQMYSLGRDFYLKEIIIFKYIDKYNILEEKNR